MQPVSPLAKTFVTFFMLLYFMLLLGIVLTPDLLSGFALGGLTIGHMLILAIHILPVIAAWTYLAQRVETTDESHLTKDSPETTE